MRLQTDANTRISLEAHQAVKLASAYLRIDHKTLLDEAVALLLEEHSDLLRHFPEDLKISLLGPNYAQAEEAVN